MLISFSHLKIFTSSSHLISVNNFVTAIATFSFGKNTLGVAFMPSILGLISILITSETTFNFSSFIAKEKLGSNFFNSISAEKLKSWTHYGNL